MHISIGDVQVAMDYDTLSELLTQKVIFEQDIHVTQFVKITNITVNEEKGIVLFDCEVLENVLN